MAFTELNLKLYYDIGLYITELVLSCGCACLLFLGSNNEIRVSQLSTEIYVYVFLSLLLFMWVVFGIIIDCIVTLLGVELHSQLSTSV